MFSVQEFRINAQRSIYFIRDIIAQKLLSRFSIAPPSPLSHHNSPILPLLCYGTPHKSSNFPLRKKPKANAFGFNRGSRIRTHDLRFWRPLFYQLNYTPICNFDCPTILQCFSFLVKCFSAFFKSNRRLRLYIASVCFQTLLFGCKKLVNLVYKLVCIDTVYHACHLKALALCGRTTDAMHSCCE